ncbi:MAG: gliding motility-associated C-terminal domain-containing protein, partial [Bacteroidetes bacterium]|nr:gliding motility-associated C-terminal domain-containing protein [Bacteroidota bacterium]
TNTGPYCAGNTIQLNTGAFATYSWSGPAAFSSASQSPSIPSASVSNSGVYTVTVSDANGCVKSTTTNVTVNPLPNPIVGSNSPVCVNNSINLTASGGTGYSWSGPNGYSSVTQNPTIANAGTIQSGVYTVTVTALGCANTGTVNVSVLTPTTSASNTGPYCAGTTIQLNNPGATSYTWTGPSAFTSNAQSPTLPSATTAMAGSYTVLVSIGSCTAIATTSVTVNALPAPLATNTGPYCAGNTIQLNTGAFTTYTWSGPSAFSSSLQSPSIPSASVSNSGIYTVTVSDVNGCVKSTTTNVTVNPLPNPVVGSNSPVCLNNSINLTAAGGTSYSWSGPNGYSSAVQNPSIANASLAQGGVYTVTVTALGCVNTGSVSVSVLNPTTTASNNGPYCAGTTIQLSTPAASSYTWSGPSAFSSNAQNATRPVATTAMSGNYTVIVSIGSCTATATTSVTVNALPIPVLNNNSPVCIGQSIIFNGNGGSSYVWNGPAGFSSVSQNPTITVSNLNSAGNYTLTVTDANNCVNTGITSVTVNAQPVVNATGTTVCQSSNAQLSASGGVSYSWSGPGGFTSAQQNPVIANAVPANSGQYTVFITDANTCTNTAVAQVVVNPAAVPQVNSNNPVCLNANINLFASGGSAYSWTGPNGFSSGLQNPVVFAGSTAMSGVYFVTVNVAGGCSGTASVNVLVNPLPSLILNSGPNKGCAPLCVTYNVQSVPSASSITWNFGNGQMGSAGLSAGSCYSTTGVYSISAKVTDVNGCSSSISYSAEVYPKPTADFAFTPVKPLENVETVHFTDISFGTPIAGWSWYFLAGSQYTSTTQNPDFLYQDAGIYPVVLIVKSDHGCLDTVLKTVQAVEDFGIWVPNAFTPNGDGDNDYFTAKGFGIVKFHMQIFDRWGESLFVCDDIHNPWPGNYQGRGDKICKDDVYVWRIVVTTINGKVKELTGHVTLMK